MDLIQEFSIQIKETLPSSGTSSVLQQGIATTVVDRPFYLDLTTISSHQENTLTIPTGTSGYVVNTISPAVFLYLETNQAISVTLVSADTTPINIGPIPVNPLTTPNQNGVMILNTANLGHITIENLSGNEATVRTVLVK